MYWSGMQNAVNRCSGCLHFDIVNKPRLPELRRTEHHQGLVVAVGAQYGALVANHHIIYLPAVACEPRAGRIFHCDEVAISAEYGVADTEDRFAQTYGLLPLRGRQIAVSR